MNILKKSKSLAVVFSAVAMTLSSQSLSAQNTRSNIPDNIVSGYLIKGGAHQNVFIYGSKDNKISYKVTPRGNKLEKSLTSFDSIYLFEPKQYRIAKSLFLDKKYEEAVTQFLKTKELYKDFKALEDNFCDLSTYYLLECYRKLKKYDELKKELEQFDSSKLTRPSHQEQLKVFKFWIAAHNKAWSQLKTLTDEWYAKVETKEAKSGYNISKPTVSIRAQVAFCQGLANEGLKQTKEALNSYAKAMTADYTKSEAIVREAALNSLAIYSKDKKVAEAIKFWETEFEKKNSAGYAALAQANALARVYNKAGLGSGVPLPDKYKKFLKYTSKEMAELLKQREENKAKVSKPGAKDQVKQEPKKAAPKKAAK